MSQTLYLKMYLFHGNPKCKWWWIFCQLFPTNPLPLSSHGHHRFDASSIQFSNTKGLREIRLRSHLDWWLTLRCLNAGATTNYDRKLRTEFCKCNYYWFFILWSWQDFRLFNLIVLVLISLLVTDSALEWQDCYVGTETISFKNSELSFCDKQTKIIQVKLI